MTPGRLACPRCWCWASSTCSPCSAPPSWSPFWSRLRPAPVHPDHSVFRRHRHPLLPYLHPPEGTRLFGLLFRLSGRLLRRGRPGFRRLCHNGALRQAPVRLRRHCSGRLLYVILAAVIKLVGVKKVMRFLLLWSLAHHHPHRPQPGP